MSITEDQDLAKPEKNRPRQERAEPDPADDVAGGCLHECGLPRQEGLVSQMYDDPHDAPGA